MADGLRRLVVRLLRVPPEPAAPVGAEQSLRLFRASPRYLGYLRALWAIRWGFVLLATAVPLTVVLGAAASDPRLQSGVLQAIVLGVVGVGVALAASMAFSWIVTTLDYEWRWYKVTDRSLRIREGIWAVRELTMTFANIQNLSVSQGPLQRLLGIADLKVQSAGGGGGGAHDPHGGAQGQSLHLGFFRGVDNAEEIREVMLERLRKLKDAGLGDEPVANPAAAPAHGGSLPASTAQLLSAIRDEAALLRAAAERG